MREMIMCAMVAVVSTGCAQKGCLTNLPPGFPADQAVTDAVQLRVTESGLRALGENADTVIDTMFPEGLSFQVPPQCDGDIEICCNAPPGTCGVTVDMARRPGDLPRLELAPQDGPGNPLESIVRMRVRTEPGPLLVKLSGRTCEVHMNTEEDDEPSLQVSTRMGMGPDPLTGNTRISIASIAVDGLDRGDIDIDGGGFICGLADTFKGIALDIIREQIAEHAAGVVESQLCRRCASNAECGSASTCSAQGMCMIDDANGSRCVQELGVIGQMVGAALHPSLSQTSSLDMQFVAGGQTSTSADGLSLGLVSGILPAAGNVLRCGPASPPPAITAPPAAPLSQLQRIEGAPEHDLAFGVHREFLDRAGWAAYQSGLLCLTVDTNMVSVLNTDALAVLFPSLGDLLPDGTGQISVRMRPQAPPTFSAGGDALLTVHMSALDIDIFAMIDERFVRLFTAHTALSVPLDIETDPDGGIIPVVGDIGQSFTKIEVEGSGLLEESPEEIASKFPAMGSLVTQLVTEVIGSIELPNLAGLMLQVPPGGARSLDSGSFIGVFASIQSKQYRQFQAGSVETEARIREIHVPAPRAGSSFSDSDRPAVELELDGSTAGEGELEWQVRINGGFWSPFSTSRRARLERPEFWLRGDHRIEVRARRVGEAASVDATPVTLIADLRQSSGGGCNAGSGGSSVWMALLLLLVLAGRGAARRIRALALALALVPILGGCTASLGEPGGNQETVVGRWSDIAVSESRILVSAYEQRYGDLVVGEVDSRGRVSFQPIDGVPAIIPGEGADGYRGGVTLPGEDVGVATSIALVAGQGRIAYHDRSGKRLKLASERGGIWQSHVIDEAPGSVVGHYVSLAASPQGALGIAYMAHGVAGPSGATVAQLRWARAISADPASAGEWSIEIVAESVITQPGTEPEPTGETLGLPGDLPPGIGHYPSAGFLPDGRAVIAFYHRDQGDLMLAIREAQGWSVKALDSAADTDTGSWAAMAIDASGAIHIAYQETTRGHLRYLVNRDGGVSPSEIVTIDDGARDTESHPVGSHTAIVVDQSGRPTVFYQDQYDVALMYAQPDEAGRWIRRFVNGGDGSALQGAFYIAAGQMGAATWVSSFAYDRRYYPPGKLSITSLSQ